MGKFLTNSEFDALKMKADNYDAIVNSIIKSNDQIKAEEVTPEFINSALATSSDEGVSAEKIQELEGTIESLTKERDELKSANETLTSDLDSEKSTNSTLQSEVDELKADNEALSKLPAGQSVAGKKGKQESNAALEDELLVFAQAHKGDTIAIAAKMQELGYV